MLRRDGARAQVIPWKRSDSAGVHSWLRIKHQPGGLGGLGLRSGRTSELTMHGVDVLVLVPPSLLLPLHVSLLYSRSWV